MPSVFVPFLHSGFTPSQLRSLTCEATLILPSVSVGNIGQLAIDALIASYSAVKVGYVRTPHILPVVAADASAASPAEVKGRLSLPVELFYSAERRLLLLQQRAPAVTGLNGAFAAQLMALIEEELQVREVVLLTSASSHLRSDPQIQHDHDTLTDTEGQEGFIRPHSGPAEDGRPQRKSPIHYVTANADERTTSVASSLEWSLVTPKASLPSRPPPAADSDDDDSAPSSAPREPALTPLYPFTPWFRGGGVGRYLWPLLEEAASSDRALHATALLVYAVEGDNARDALMMAREVDAFIRRRRGEGDGKVEWKTPLSWQFVFGRAPQSEIYL